MYKTRVLIVALFCIVGATAIAVAVSQFRQPKLKNMTLEEALWTCSQDMKTYYPPGSSESREMVRVLSPKLSPDFRTTHLICARMGNLEVAQSSEPIIWEIDPKQISERQSTSTIVR